MVHFYKIFNISCRIFQEIFPNRSLKEKLQRKRLKFPMHFIFLCVNSMTSFVSQQDFIETWHFQLFNSSENLKIILLEPWKVRKNNKLAKNSKIKISKIILFFYLCISQFTASENVSQLYQRHSSDKPQGIYVKLDYHYDNHGRSSRLFRLA